MEEVGDVSVINRALGTCFSLTSAQRGKKSSSRFTFCARIIGFFCTEASLSLHSLYLLKKHFVPLNISLN